MTKTEAPSLSFLNRPRALWAIVTPPRKKSSQKRGPGLDARKTAGAAPWSEQTRSYYVRHVRAFTAFIGRSPDTATTEDLRLFQLHQTQIGMQPPSINSAVAALRFFFTVMLERLDLAQRLTVVLQPRRIPAVPPASRR